MATRNYNRLTLTSGQTYLQPNADTINVLNYTSGDFDGAIIRSDSAGNAFNLNLPGTTVTVRSVTFKDTDASGGAKILVIGGTDEGGNINIEFGALGGMHFRIWEDDDEE